MYDQPTGNKKMQIFNCDSIRFDLLDLIQLQTMLSTQVVGRFDLFSPSSLHNACMAVVALVDKQICGCSYQRLCSKDKLLHPRFHYKNEGAIIATLEDVPQTTLTRVSCSRGNPSEYILIGKVILSQP